MCSDRNEKRRRLAIPRNASGREGELRRRFLWRRNHIRDPSSGHVNSVQTWWWSSTRYAASFRTQIQIPFVTMSQLYSKQIYFYKLVYHNMSSNSSTCVKTTKTSLIDSPTYNTASEHFIPRVAQWFNKAPFYSREMAPYV